MIPIARPLLGDEEAEAVRAVLASGQLAQGPRVEEFEAAFARLCGVREAVAVSSGTAALTVALLAYGVGPGDEVITTPFSFIATANAILAAGAHPVFADVCPDDFNIDPQDVARCITPRTRAILPVHLYGHPSRMGELTSLASAYNLAVVEDACQAHGAAVDGRPVGSFGSGCFSFYATKNMTTGEGGMITTNDSAVAAAARTIRDHGATTPYHHERLGYNWRLTEMAAAIGLVQLRKLEGFNERRRANAAYLSARLRRVVTPTERSGCRHVYHQYTVRAPQARGSPERSRRDALLAHLTLRGIAASVYYATPIHQQPLYLKLGYHDCLPVAESLSREVLSLPVHPALGQEDLATIVEAVASFVAEEA